MKNDFFGLNDDEVMEVWAAFQYGPDGKMDVTDTPFNMFKLKFSRAYMKLAEIKLDKEIKQGKYNPKRKATV